MTECTHPDTEYDGMYPREYPANNWVLVKLYTCRKCHTHLMRKYQMTVDPNYLEQEMVHDERGNLVTQAVRRGETA